mmetsp:Transcript_949/g.5982  ORF Transcript_949/g.5982 Transcript_949/m.5982 type:complete len:83 (-) Transcript_949:2681-2929(-)
MQAIALGCTAPTDLHEHQAIPNFQRLPKLSRNKTAMLRKALSSKSSRIGLQETIISDCCTTLYQVKHIKVQRECFLFVHSTG